MKIIILIIHKNLLIFKKGKNFFYFLKTFFHICKEKAYEREFKLYYCNTFYCNISKIKTLELYIKKKKKKSYLLIIT
jgi:hypothetical protein